MLEERFGCDFSDVRLHIGPAATASTRALRAKAYTCGDHVVFDEEHYRPETPKGFWLLAHELAHVVQQRLGDATPYASRTLEFEADRAATLAVNGEFIPEAFTLSPAPTGVIQCHTGETCPGVPVSAANQAVWMPANEAIEIAYREDARHRTHSNAIFYGSQFENRDVLLPAGVPNKKFGNILLKRLRGLVKQRRPDIIDFHERVFYEIKAAHDTRRGTVQIQSYYKIADEIRREYAAYAEPPWRIEYATWYPPHVLPLPGDPIRRIVCTQATDHQRYPALLLYDVRELSDDERRKRRQVKVSKFKLYRFNEDFSVVWPMMKSELFKKITTYDTSYPHYVIIIPREFYWEWYRHKNEKTLDLMRVKPPFLDPKHPVGQFHIIAGSATLIAAGLIAGWAIVAAASTLAASSAMYAASASGAATGGTAAGGGTVIYLATYKAALVATPAVKPLAAAAGVLLIVGTAKDAAANGQLKNPMAVRAVNIRDFKAVKGVQTATSAGLASGTSPDPPSAGRLKMGTEVMFDGVPYIIAGQLSAQ